MPIGVTMADNLQKRPFKGILKNSSSFDKQDARPAPSKKNKETKWDEMNIIATLHPPDKDYGHMKIDEPKTPYNYEDDEEPDAVDATELAEKIQSGNSNPPKAMRSYSETESDEDDADLTPDARAKKKEFESKRKKHYNEYYAVKLARKLLEEEDEDESDDEPTKSPPSTSSKGKKGSGSQDSPSRTNNDMQGCSKSSPPQNK